MKEKTYVFRLSGRIDEIMYQRFFVFCKQLDKDAKNVYLYIMSSGGDLGWATKIIDLMHKTPVAFNTIAYTKVHSAAIPIFASGSVRAAKKGRDTFLFHEPKIKDEDILEFSRIDAKQNFIQYLTEITGTHNSVISTLIVEKTYLTSEQAKDINLVNYLIP